MVKTHLYLKSFRIMNESETTDTLVDLCKSVKFMVLGAATCFFPRHTSCATNFAIDLLMPNWLVKAWRLLGVAKFHAMMMHVSQHSGLPSAQWLANQGCEGVRGMGAGEGEAAWYRYPSIWLEAGESSFATTHHSR